MVDVGAKDSHHEGRALLDEAERGGVGVVDNELRVFGVANLYIVDASVMPNIVSGNTCSPTLAIAEKASRMMIANK